MGGDVVLLDEIFISPPSEGWAWAPGLSSGWSKPTRVGAVCSPARTNLRTPGPALYTRMGFRPRALLDNGTA